MPIDDVRKRKSKGRYKALPLGVLKMRFDSPERCFNALTQQGPFTPNLSRHGDTVKVRIDVDVHQEKLHTFVVQIFVHTSVVSVTDHDVVAFHMLHGTSAIIAFFASAATAERPVVLLK